MVLVPAGALGGPATGKGGRAADPPGRDHDRQGFGAVAFRDRAAGALDDIDLFVIPVLRGDGVRAFPTAETGASVTLRSAEALGAGMVRLSYDFDGPG